MSTPTVKFAAEPSPMVHEFLVDAQTLAAEKEDLFARIDANRVMLRNLRTMGKCSKEQADAVAAFYKDRESKKDAAVAEAAAPDAPAAPAEKSAKK